MKSITSEYFAFRRDKIRYGLDKAKRMKVCYLFLLPYAILFFTFFILYPFISCTDR